MNSFGAPFCRGIEPFLANLKALLDESERMGVGDYPAAVKGRAVYDDVSGYLAYVPFIGNDCERNTNEVRAAIVSMTSLLQATPGSNLSVPRPDAEMPEAYGLPSWVVPVAIGAAVLYGLAMINSVVPHRRLAGRNRRSKR